MDKKLEKEKRLAQQLRENLIKRKQTSKKLSQKILESQLSLRKRQLGKSAIDIKN
ncbi:hypothetical protein [Bartonella sp. DGB1]|uniref:hypothetical protein n=1 Tax=Bartonella sp. DGB1 TaxID=3239807 RepID=UPI003525F4C1